jgi:hypothetical protein
MQPTDDVDVDRFATLFSPPTPPATPHPITHSRPPSTDHLRPTLPPRQDSSDSLLLIPVPTASDPLRSSVSPVRESRSHSLDFFEKFVDGAKLASERSKKLLLDELLEHEDDPLYFLTESNRGQQASGSADVAGPQTAADLQEHTSDLLSLSEPSQHFNEPPTEASTDAQLHVSKSLSRSYPNLGTLSSRWMGSSSKPILPSPSRSQPLETLFHAELPTVESPRSSDAISALHAHFAQQRLHTPQQQHHVSREKAASLITISHGSPFAPHPSLPPSGAPGFVDDRSWDKGFSSEYDNSTIGKGLDLEGRKEVNVEVVDKTLADLVS